MKRHLGIVCAALLVATHAEGAAFRVRSFLGARISESSTGDREPGAGGAFWLVRGIYDTPTGWYAPHVQRLTTDGALTTWKLDEPQSFFPFSVRRDASTGAVWVLVPRIATREAALYRLDPQTDSLSRMILPFLGTGLHLDPQGGVPWVVGTGHIARYAGTTLTVWEVDNFAGGTSGFDQGRRLWLSADNRQLAVFHASDGHVERWTDAQESMGSPAVSASGDVWGWGLDQFTYVRFRPSTREVVVYPMPAAAPNWAGLRATGDGLAQVAGYGPHFLSTRTAELTGGTARTLGPPVSSTPSATTSTLTPLALTPVRTTSTVPTDDRVVYSEADGGRTLATISGTGFSSIPWAGGGETLSGDDPVQWWQALPGGEAFEVTQALPVAVEVRPDNPTSNFFSEVTLTNVDADPSVSLTFTTEAGSVSADVTLAKGASKVYPNVIQALRDLGAGIPSGGVAGTLRARFRNGTGTLQSRVYTRGPDGSTTGLGFTSVDPTKELYVFRRTLNGLKATAAFRTNVALANFCGGSGTCPTFEASLEFYDDTTGQRVGEANVRVPPYEWRQLDAPLAGMGVTGESFSVLVTPYSAGLAAYDAYATVIDNANQDAAYFRALPVAATDDLTLPVVTDAGGIGTRFTSEAAISNPTNGEITIDVTFTSSRSGNSVSEVLRLPARRGVRWANAVGHFRELDPAKVDADDFGPVRLHVHDFNTAFASARTTASNGTGLGFVALDPMEARASRRKRIVGLKESSAYRTNLAVVHTGATTNDPNATIGIRVTVTDSAGRAVGEPLTRTLSPGQLYQWTKVLPDFLGVTGEGYAAVIERTDGVDAFDAYVTIIDNASSDPTFIRAE